MNSLTSMDSLQQLELLQKVIAAQPLGIALVDKDLRVKFWNDWIAQWSGMPDQHVIGESLDSVFPNLAGTEFCSVIERVIKQGGQVCWSQNIDPERLDSIERAMTSGDRELPLHRVSLSAIESEHGQLCLVQIDEAPYDPMAVVARKPDSPVIDGEMPAYMETEWLAVLLLDKFGTIQDFNPAAEAMFGFNREQLKGAPVRLLLPDLAELPEGDLKYHLEDKVRQQSENLLEAATADGHSLFVQVQAFRSVTHSDNYVVTVRDATALCSTQESLFRQRELISAVFGQVADGLLMTDDQGLVEHVNPVGKELLRTNDATGMLVKELLTFSDDTGRQLPCPASEALSRGTVVSLPEGAHLSIPGQDPVSMMATATPLRNRRNELVGVVVVFRAVSESRRLSSKLTWQSLHDPLTQLPNRRQLEAELARLIEDSQQNRTTHTLLYIDLYNFSVINDTCGHNAGDELLRQFARLFTRHVSNVDMVARLGNDEFAVLLRNKGGEEGREIAEELLWQIKSFSFPWGERRLRIGASIGGKVINSDTRTEIDVLVAAGAACATARESGRNRVHFQYQSQDIAHRQSVAAWIPRITEALEEDRFVLYAQPIVPTFRAALTTRHYELLVRMVDREGKLVPPGEFIPAAEHYGLIDDLDRWTFERLLSYLQEQRSQEHSYQQRFSLNLSGHSVGDEGFREYVLSRLDETGVDPKQLQFEITETAAVRNFDRAMEFIRALKAKGCYFSLDDFGSGLSSFAYLKQLPVDFLKIDGSFIKKMEFNDIDYSMISTINHLGHIMGIHTVAECVENENQMAMLREIGIDYVQGYHVAQPRPIEQL
ncbi:EAL domain-containing protein [Porticoccaceae bacterium LTM1]|nr:EAL domain-containing protein [Porticoccaceae bacterium LTM1]